MNESSPVDRSRLTALAEKMREAASDLHGMCSDAGYRECVTILRDGTPALLAELAEKDAEIEQLRERNQHYAMNQSGVAGGNLSGYTMAEVEAEIQADHHPAAMAKLGAERDRLSAARTTALTAPRCRQCLRALLPDEDPAHNKGICSACWQESGAEGALQ